MWKKKKDDKNQSIETDQERTYDKVSRQRHKTIIVTIFHMFKNLEEILNMLSRHRRHKKDWNRNPRDENYEMKNTLDRLNIRLHITKVKIVEPKATIEISQNKREREKGYEKLKEYHWAVG